MTTINNFARLVRRCLVLLRGLLPVIGLSFVLGAPALSSFSAPPTRYSALGAQSSGTHAENVYGRYLEIPQSLQGLISVSSCHGGELCETRSGSGQPVTTRYNAYVYSSSNPSGRISASYVVDASKALVSGFSLAYRTDGQVATQETFASDGAGGMSCERTVYGYDSLGRLSSEDRTSCGTVSLSDIGETLLSYDASGNNVLERAGSGALQTTTYTGRDRLSERCIGTACRAPRYGPRGGLSGDGTESFSYTDAARLLSRHAGADRKGYRYLPDGLLWETQADGESGIYFYRAAGELSSRTHRLSTGAEEISHNFWFEGLNARTVTDDGSSSGFDYGFSDYMGSTLTETNAAGETAGLRRYGHAGDPLYRHSREGGTPAMKPDTSTSGHLGSFPRVPGTAANASSQNDALKAWPLGYSGGYTDKLDDSHPLTFFGVREQESGRFLEADTDLSQPNAYVYAADNWPNRVDMTGHAAEPVFSGEVFGEASSGTDLPTCDELNPDCQMPALPDTGGGGGGGGGGGDKTPIFPVQDLLNPVAKSLAGSPAELMEGLYAGSRKLPKTLSIFAVLGSTGTTIATVAGTQGNAKDIVWATGTMVVSTVVSSLATFLHYDKAAWFFNSFVMPVALYLSQAGQKGNTWGWHGEDGISPLQDMTATLIMGAVLNAAFRVLGWVGGYKLKKYRSGKAVVKDGTVPQHKAFNSLEGKQELPKSQYNLYDDEHSLNSSLNNSSNDSSIYDEYFPGNEGSIGSNGNTTKRLPTPVIGNNGYYTHNGKPVLTIKEGHLGT